MSNAANTAAVTIVGGPPLSQRVPLRWTYQHEGRTYDAISIKRLRVAEVRALMAAQRAAEEKDPDASLPLPIYVDDAGDPVPTAVIDALLDDDLVRLEREATDFFPGRFRARATAASPSDTGDDTGPISDA